MDIPQRSFSSLAKNAGPGGEDPGSSSLTPPGDELAHRLEREGLKRFAQRLIAHEGWRMNQYNGGVLKTTKIWGKKAAFNRIIPSHTLETSMDLPENSHYSVNPVVLVPVHYCIGSSCW